MGLFDKVKKAFGSKEDEIKNESTDEIIYKSDPVESLNKEIIERPATPENVKSFKYLDGLIHGGEKRIALDSDIIISDDEVHEYIEGISIDANDIVIDGNGHSIDARKETQIFKITGHNVVLKNLTFKNAAISGFHFDVTDVNEIENIMSNNVISGGAAIQNFGITSIESSKFFGNESHEIAGAIVNAENAFLELKDCEFKDNQASEFAVIDNFSKLKIEDCLFEKNSSTERGGVMGSAGELEIINSRFINNATGQRGGAIINWGNIKIYDSLFDKNSSNGAGGSIFNQQGNLFVSNSRFENNSSKDGAAIFNFDVLSVENSRFINNASRNNGGAIFNYEIGKVEIKDCEFKNNDAFNYGTCIYNKNNMRIVESIFVENNNIKDIIFNQSTLELVDLSFSKNNANSLIMNDEGSMAAVNGGKALNNSVNKSTIYNLGEFNLNIFTFDNNRSSSPFSENILNEGQFNLSEVMILSENDGKTILNKGYLGLKELTESLEKTICNQGEIKVMNYGTKPHSEKYPPN